MYLSGLSGRNIIHYNMYLTIMHGFSVCLFANSSFGTQEIDVKLANPPQRHPWSVLRGLAFHFRSYFENSNGTVLSAVLERHHFNDTINLTRQILSANNGYCCY